MKLVRGEIKLKKVNTRNIIKVIYILLAIGGISTMFIIYKDYDNKFTFRFVVAYILFLFISVLYMVVISLLQLKKLKWVDIKKRLIRFIMGGITISILNCFFDYIFMPDRTDIVDNSVNAFALSFAITFFDLMFLKIKN